MESSLGPQGGTLKKHKRHPSSGERRVSMPRRPTKGPLDEENARTIASTVESDVRTATTSPAPGIGPSESMTTISDHLKADFSNLLRPEIYHFLNPLEIPEVFRSSSIQPSPDTPLSVLLANGHFRAAAILSARLLITSTGPTDHEQIFSLLYTRLATLTLIDATPLAAQEVRALEDMNSPKYHDPVSGEHIVPWELRVLAVRLQSIGFGDWRRGVMGYYELAREARGEVLRCRGSAKDMWKDRLKDLGLRVGNALIEMGDFEGATRHLDGLRGTMENEDDNRTLLMQLSLLYLRIGDVSAARRCFLRFGEEERTNYEEYRMMSALCSMSDGKYEEAAREWKRMRDAKVCRGTEMVTQNLAVCLLYNGRLSEARKLLEGLVDKGNSFHALTFNLSTIYELCTEKSRSLKTGLAEKIAAQPEKGTGWERMNMDFKL